MADPCGVDFGVPEARGIHGAETLAKLSVLGRGFRLLGSLLRFLANTQFNLRVLADAAPFVIDQPSKRQKITAGQAELIYRNTSGTYVALYVQAESYVSGTTVVDSIFALDVNKEDCLPASAKQRLTGRFPECTLWIPPNTALYGYLVDTSNGVQTTYTITLTPVPLRGTGAYFGQGGE